MRTKYQKNASIKSLAPNLISLNSNHFKRIQQGFFDIKNNVENRDIFNI